MKILVVDGQGGGMGRQLIEQIKKTTDTGNAIFLSYQSIIHELDNPQTPSDFKI